MVLSMPCDSLLIVVTFPVSIYHEENAHGDRPVQLANQLINTVPIGKHTVCVKHLLDERSNIKGGRLKQLSTFSNVYEPVKHP